MIFYSSTMSGFFLKKIEIMLDKYATNGIYYNQLRATTSTINKNKIRRKIMSYIIFDNTSNTGKEYIDFNGKNVEQIEMAREFTTREEAEEFAKSLNSDSEWYSIEEYHELELSIKTYNGNATVFLSQKNGETLSWKDVTYSADDLLAYEGQTEDEVLDEYREEIQEWIWEVEAELPYQTYLDNDKLDDIMLSLKIQLSPMLP